MKRNVGRERLFFGGSKCIVIVMSVNILKDNDQRWKTLKSKYSKWSSLGIKHDKS